MSEGGEHVLLDEALDHVVGGNDNVIIYRAARKLCVHILVGGVGGVADAHSFAVGLVIPSLKLLVGVDRAFAAVGDVFAPVVDVKGLYLAAVLTFTARGEGDEREREKGEGEEQRKDSCCFFHLPCPPLLFFLPETEPVKLTASSITRIVATIRAQSAYMLNLTLCTVWL